MSYIVETSCFNFVAQGVGPAMIDGNVVHQHIDWRTYLQDILSAGGQFIELRRHPEYVEMTVAYPNPANRQQQAPQYAPEHYSDGPVIQARNSQSIDDLINSDRRIL